MTHFLSRSLVAVELLMLALFLPGAVLGFVMFSGAPISLWSVALTVAALFSALTWAAVYFQALGYVRTNHIVDAEPPDWARLIALFGPLPAAAAAVFLAASPPRHPSALDALPLVACLIWIPAIHLELIRLHRRRSNNRWRGP